MRHLAFVFGGFVAICGALLLIVGAPVEPPPTDDSNARAASEELEQAEQALDSENYGRARERIRRAARLLRADLGAHAEEGN